jgi:hypothetical protein
MFTAWSSLLVSFSSMVGSAAEIGTAVDSGASTSVEVPVEAKLALAWADFDADGLADVYAIDADGADRLYRNAGDGSFEDVTLAVGLPETLHSSSACWADFDLDGRQDLYLAASREELRLLRNAGDGTFQDLTHFAGLGEESRAERAEWFDYDGDGYPDLVLGPDDDERLFHNAEGEWFEAVVLGRAVARPSAARSGVNPNASSIPETTPPQANDARGAAAGDAAAPGEQVSEAASPTSAPRVRRSPRRSASPNEPLSLPPVQPVCPQGVDDVLLGGAQCIPASSTATLGHLYPISNTLFVDSTNARVGIGTQSPSAPFMVTGYVNSIAGVGRTLQLESFAPNVLFRETQSGNYYRIALFNSSQDLYFDRFDPNGNGLMTDMILKAGNVGIGTAAPNFSARLHVNDGQLAVSERHAFNAQTGVWGQTAVFADGDYNDTGHAVIGSTSLDEGRGPLGFVVADGEHMAIDIEGRVAIGAIGTFTQATDAKLDVQGRVEVDCLRITGGCDIVEGFQTGTEALDPGTVVVIDSNRPGDLAASASVYDRRVAGVVSGAGGVKAGLALGQDGVLDGETQVAVAGRVYVKCSAENGAIAPGDLLTTSSIRGHAMRATDVVASNGTVLGKAMGRLDAGTGLVLALVNLQ